MDVPVIDLSAWRAGGATGAGADELARAVDDACRRIGFMQVVGHGIPDEVTDALLAATDEFFARPVEEKLRCVPSDPSINRGYAALGSEALAYSLGVEVPRPDLFEAFNVGPELAHPPEDDPIGAFAPNVWPDDRPGLREATMAYFDEAWCVALVLTEVFARALELPDGWFGPMVDRSTVTMRVNHYEQRPGDPQPSDGQMRMGAHTDYGMVTVLHADPVPGLQIVGPDGAWHDVVPLPGALLVNLGDLTAQWTNDRWRSTLHRVVPAAVTRRSVAFFFDANHDAVIEPVPTCHDASNPRRYGPVVAGEHLLAKVLGPRTLSISNATDTTGDRRTAVAPHPIDPNRGS